MTTLCRDIIFEFLEHQKIPYLFGNPGTTELPLIDGCNDHPSVQYVMAPHEDVAVAQAMGYARASGKIGVVNLHVAPGLAHGLGNLYNAFRARVPLLVTTGQHHTRLAVQEPILAADLVGMARPFTKWAYEVSFAEELPVALQRAFKELTTPPYGPVFLSLPVNVLLDKRNGQPSARVSQVVAVTADRAGIDRAARVLTEAGSPLVLAGDGVGHAGAWDEVARLAELLGAPVLTESYSTLWNFPSRHPLYAGPMPHVAGEMRRRFDEVDAVLLCGVTSQAPVARYDDGGPLIPWRVRAVAVDDSPWEVGKNQPVEVGLVGDVRRNLAALATAITSTRPDPHVVRVRQEAIKVSARARADRWEAEVRRARAATGISATLIAAELRDRLPADAVLVDESISNRLPFISLLSFTDPLAYFAANGLSLGYSVGAAVGIQLARPERRVVNLVGDGSLMYYPQALWSAATAATPVLFVVLNNGGYRVLEVILERMGGPWAEAGAPPPGLDFPAPAIDFVALARSMGVDGELVATPAELGPALQRGLDADRPYLLDVLVAHQDKARR